MGLHRTAKAAGEPLRFRRLAGDMRDAMTKEPKDRRESSWGNDRFVWSVALGAGIGVAVGTAFGAAFGNIGIGSGVGVAVGAAIGILFARMSSGYGGNGGAA